MAQHDAIMAYQKLQQEMREDEAHKEVKQPAPAGTYEEP